MERFNYLFSKQLQKISLYIHIPFCTKKCGYCDFYSIIGASKSLISETLRETFRQFQYFNSILEKPKIQTLYIGGGTPTSIPITELEKFLGKLDRTIQESPLEATIESNPETITPDLLKMLSNTSISRISVGMQSFDDKVLETVGRNTDSLKNKKALDLLSKYWNRDLNLDLIFNIPGQSEESALNDLQTAAGTGCSHISAYSLTIENKTPLELEVFEGRLELKSEEKEEYFWELYGAVLEQAGYDQYEVSNFAKPGKECKHNIRYWKMLPYLGCGPSAVSTLQSADGQIFRINNQSALEKFIQGKYFLWNSEFEDIQPKDFLLETVMMGFRLREGLSDIDFKARFGISMTEVFPKTLKRWIDSGHLEHRKMRYFLNSAGLILLDAFLVSAALEIDSFKLPITINLIADS